MSQLDPNVIFDMIAHNVPPALRDNVVIIGSLAAAYHYRHVLKSDGVNTKDADVVVQPAGALPKCAQIASELLSLGWRRTDKCRPRTTREPLDELSVIRLNPPDSDTYFLEILAFPEANQAEDKAMLPVQLEDGDWYVVPTFRHLRLIGERQQTSEQGLKYAAPEMMALSNLLAHPRIGTARIGLPLEGDRRPLRSAKDLGRVLALAHLAGRNQTESWPKTWKEAMRQTYLPAHMKELGSRAGDGVRALLANEDAFDDAHFSVDVGILRGHRLTSDQLRTVAERLVVDTIEPFEELVRAVDA